MRSRVFVARGIPDCGLALLRKHFDVEVWGEGMPPSREVLLSRVVGCAGILSTISDVIDEQVMIAAGPTLKGVANFAVGYNNIDVTAAKSRGIQVGNTPNVLTEATADIAVGLVLAAARHFQVAIQNVQQLEWKTWEPLGFLGHELAGRTLGIVGMGRIGAAVARRLHHGWGMNVLYTSRSPKEFADRDLSARRVAFEELVRSSDVISIHTDLNSETKQMFSTEQFEMMRSNAILINTARGGVIDQAALYEALLSEKIFAAGLDVTDPEPLPSDSPLRSLANCTILPHIGSATHSARDRMSLMAAENLLAAIQGQPMPHSV